MRGRGDCGSREWQKVAIRKLLVADSGELSGISNSEPPRLDLRVEIQWPFARPLRPLGKRVTRSPAAAGSVQVSGPFVRKAIPRASEWRVKWESLQRGGDANAAGAKQVPRLIRHGGFARDGDAFRVANLVTIRKQDYILHATSCAILRDLWGTVTNAGDCGDSKGRTCLSSRKHQSLFPYQRRKCKLKPTLHGRAVCGESSNTDGGGMS